MGKKGESQNCEEENLVKGEVNTNTPSPSIHTTMVQNVHQIENWGLRTLLVSSEKHIYTGVLIHLLKENGHKEQENTPDM